MIEDKPDQNEQTLTDDEVELIFSALSLEIPDESYPTKLSYFKNQIQSSCINKSLYL